MQEDNYPDWVPKNAGNEFTTSLVKGVKSQHDGLSDNRKSNSKSIKQRKQLSVNEYIQGVLSGNRTILARTITLIESNSFHHIQIAQEVLRNLLPYTGKSIRIGITGIPGAGKSTFIETIGNKLINERQKLAVLAVDPSSSITKGSVLGDKTRMEILSRQLNCFIRPSPSGGKLGGVTRKTRETILVCEAAGYDIIFIETVGVGQNEITVRSMVDFFLLLKIAGAGDELQGIKKGVIELADAIVINKADGDNFLRAKTAQQDFSRALHYLKSPTTGWKPKVLTASSINNDGINEIWDMILQFMEIVQKSDVFQKRRHEQMITWIHALIKERLHSLFYHNPKIISKLPEIEKEVVKGKLPPTTAAQELLEIFEKSINRPLS